MTKSKIMVTDSRAPKIPSSIRADALPHNTFFLGRVGTGEYGLYLKVPTINGHVVVSLQTGNTWSNSNPAITKYEPVDVEITITGPASKQEK